MDRIKLLGCLVVALFTLLIPTACSPFSKANSELDPVALQLKWVNQSQFAGFYVAAEKGFYQDENIDIILNEGGVGIDINEEVLEGRADFGLTGAEYIVIGRSEGKPIKAIAVTYPYNPFVLVSMPGSGIKQPADLLGKTVSIGDIDGIVQVIAMFNNLGLDFNQVDVIDYSYDLQPFYDGKIDVVPAFAAGSLIPMLEEYPDLNLIWPIDYGVHFYSDTLFTLDSLIESNPDLVSRFLRASLKGHVYAIDHPQEALEISLQYADDPDPVLQKDMLDASVPFVYTGEDKIGWMRKDVWMSMIDILDERSLLAAPVDVDDVFTMQFLEEIFEDKQ